MRRSHLVPEKRTDRTGRTQTRWVKLELKLPSPSRPLPAPPVPADEHTLACGALMAEFARARLFRVNRDELRASVMALRTETVRAALGVAQGATEHTLISLADEVRCIDPALPHDDANLPFFVVEELYGRHWPQPMGPRAGNLIAAVRNVRAYPGLSFDGSLPRRVAAAHMVAACEIWERLNRGKQGTNDASPWLVQEPALVELFEEHHERAAELAEFVIQHGPDTGAMLAFLRGDPLALAGGEL